MRTKQWQELNSTLEKYEFLRRGRALRAGIIAPEMDGDVTEAFRSCLEAETKRKRILDNIKSNKKNSPNHTYNKHKRRPIPCEFCMGTTRTFEEETAFLLQQFSHEQKEEVFSQEECCVDSEFIGFIEHYKHLALLIPKHFTVIDLGCGYAAQSFYFKDHRNYIGVDVSLNKYFTTPNGDYYRASIQDFISKELPELDLDLERVFAICSYVPPWGADNLELTRKHFLNVFTFYPAS